MRSLISGMIMIASVASTGVPASAADVIGAQSGSTWAHMGGHPHPGPGHHHDGHHRHRHLLVPYGYYGFYDSAPAPDVAVVNPDPSSETVAPPAPQIPAADRPPCQETGAGGVIVLRGMGCTRTH